MTKVALMQPTFFPWMGYFELIAKADKFVFLDDFQFVYRSFLRRNRFFVSKDVVQMVCVPIDRKTSYQIPINETVIKEQPDWQSQLWNKIRINYGRAKYFSTYAEEIMSVLLDSYDNLAKQNITIILCLCKILDINTTILYSSDIKATGKRSVRNKNLLNATGADIYISAHGSFGYMLEDGVFPLDNIEVSFQNAELDPYPQIGSTKGFVPYLSVIDALFNIGAEKTRELIDHTTKHWLTWDEMLKIHRGGGVENPPS